MIDRSVKTYEPNSDLARNFLVIAPNIIVLDRLLKDFDGLRIFLQDPAIPENGFHGQNWIDDFLCIPVKMAMVSGRKWA